MSLFAEVVHINADHGYRYSESGVEDTERDTPGEVFRYAIREFGRCTSKVYIDRRVKTNDDGGERWETTHVGWVFVSREKYEDCDDTYLRETWVTLFEAPPERILHYAEASR